MKLWLYFQYIGPRTTILETIPNMLGTAAQDFPCPAAQACAPKLQALGLLLTVAGRLQQRPVGHAQLRWMQPHPHRVRLSKTSADPKHDFDQCFILADF